MRVANFSWNMSRFRFPNRTRRPRQPGANNRIAVWLACITIVVSLFAPLLTIAASDAAASAAQVDRRCPNGEVLNEDTGECEPESQPFPNIQSGQQTPEFQRAPTATATEPASSTVPDPRARSTAPVLTTVPALELEPEGDGDSSVDLQIVATGVKLTKWECAPGVPPDPYFQADIATLQAECAHPASVAVGITYDNEQIEPKPKTVTDTAEWLTPETSATTHTLTEAIPPGYGQPVVFCGIDPQGDAGPSLGRMPIQSGTTVTWQGPLAVYDYLHCDWFNIATGTESDSSLDVTKHACPEGTDPALGLPDLETLCSPAEGVEFTVSWRGFVDQDNTSTRETDANGKVTWPNLIADAQGLSETVPPGYGPPVVFCSLIEGGEPQAMPVQNGAILIEYDAHDSTAHHTTCWWFNFPGDDGSVTILKYNCPVGATIKPGVANHQDACAEPGNGIDFTLQNVDGESTKTVQNGGVSWEGLPDGQFTITEQIPDGWGDPTWFCEYENRDALPGAPHQGNAVTGTFDSREHGKLLCWVFNFPTGNGDGDNNLTVFKYLCEDEPAGFTSLGEWQDACPTQGDGVKFTLTNANGPQTEQTVNGKAEWFSVPEGPFTLSETVPAGYGEPVVWCGWTTLFDGKVADAFPQLVQAPGGVFQGTMPQPETTYTCWWFNIPDDDRSVTIHKYTCPASTAIKPGLANYQDACTEPGDGIEFTLQNSDGESTKMVQNGVVTWSGVSGGQFTVTEHVPNGWGEPVWFCEFPNRDNPPDVHHGDAVTATMDSGEHRSFTCWVFNFPDRSHQVTAFKWICPYDALPDSDDYQAWRDACTTSVVGWEFTLTNDDGSSTKATGPAGNTTWYGVPGGTNTLSEDLPPGVDALAAVFCNLEAAGDAGGQVTEDWTRYTVVDNGVSKELNFPLFHWTCHFFNQPEGPGEITIHKWLCPPAYDYTAYGADPKVDCTVVTDGIDFTLDQPVGPNHLATTGDAGPGSVSWGDLEAGAYTVTETVPQAIASVFVWDCTGTDIPAVQPTPLNVGNVLTIDVAAGDAIVCNWYNVPPPDDGWITVYKYACWTETFTSEIDCQIYESGASFELFAVGGTISQGVGTTNAAGAYTWNNLDEGAYSLTEISHTPCHVVASEVDSNGNAWVDPLEETVIKVYNCDTDHGGKIPQDYPDTGVAPADVAPSLQGTSAPAGTPVAITSEEFYEISCLEEPITVDDSEGAQGWAQGDIEATSPPIETIGTPPSGGEEECVRGSLPAHLTIDAANVDAAIEVVEIVDGVMQAPTGPNIAAWYKDTARLGETNNLIIAGHLNWWNVPEGVFFHLSELDEGDRIEITGEDGLTYIYDVQWTRQEDNSKPPAIDVVGPTDQPSLTLITCGGEWDSAVSEYNARTVVRAVQVDVIDDSDVKG